MPLPHQYADKNTSQIPHTHTCFRRRFSSSRNARAVSSSPVSFATRFCTKRGIIRLLPFDPTFAPHWGQLRLSYMHPFQGGKSPREQVRKHGQIGGTKSCSRVTFRVS